MKYGLGERKQVENVWNVPWLRTGPERSFPLDCMVANNKATKPRPGRLGGKKSNSICRVLLAMTHHSHIPKIHSLKSLS